MVWYGMVPYHTVLCCTSYMNFCEGGDGGGILSINCGNTTNAPPTGASSIVHGAAYLGPGLTVCRSTVLVVWYELRLSWLSHSSKLNTIIMGT